ncbi:MAG TPA: M23 family metallopeptidase, partial [Bryobacteraceae bacterium]|nr:M23 family metallopeptidase [Bryobacteraceae bacterium]
GKQSMFVVKSIDDVEGNYVVLDVGDGRFVTYAHLIPGSLTVKRGDRVRAGQVLGKIGNSGNSSGPHLHFQVATGPGVLRGDGVPFVFDSFYHARDLRQNEIPLRDWLVHFP